MGAFMAAASLGGNLLSRYFAGRGSRKAATALTEEQKAAQAGALQAGQDAQDVLAGAGQRFDAATGEAIAGLEETRGGLKANLDPYLIAGQQGATSLADLARKGFDFKYEDYRNDPAFQFQLEQGADARLKSAAGRGAAVGGNILTELERYGQGLASTYYDQAFQRALKGFGANVDVNRALATEVGLPASGQLGTNERFFGGQIAANRIGAGEMGVSIADLIARTKERTARTAGDYGVGAGATKARGILDKYDALAGAAGDVASIPSLIDQTRQERARKRAAQINV